jgi:hypothetical protein
MAMTKQGGEGEQLHIDVAQWNPVTGVIEHETSQEVFELFEEGVRYSELRLYEMNVRMLESYKLERYCPPEQWNKILDVLAIIGGQMSAATVAARWKSAIEETLALEEGRKLAMAKQYEEHLATLPTDEDASLPAYETTHIQNGERN